MTFDETNMFDDVTNKEVPAGSIGYFGDTPSKIMYLIEKNAKPSVLRGVLEYGTLKRYVTDDYFPDYERFYKGCISKEAYRYFYFIDFKTSKKNKKQKQSKEKNNNEYYNFTMSGTVSEYKGDSFILNCNGSYYPFIFLQGLPSVSIRKIVDFFPLQNGQNITLTFIPFCDEQNNILALEALSIVSVNDDK